MKRIATVIFSILLGALAVGIGMGIYLNKANQDRLRLEQVANQAQEQSRTVMDQSQKAIQEANDKLKAANDEVMKAQEALKTVESERELLSKADNLPTIDPKTLRAWAEAVNLEQGLTLKYPPSSIVESNDIKALTLALKPKTTDTVTYDTRWLSITPYDIRLENELLATITSSTQVSYALKGKLLYGVEGYSQDLKSKLYILRLQSMGQLSHLVWGRESTEKKSQVLVLPSLSTLTFQK